MARRGTRDAGSEVLRTLCILLLTAGGCGDETAGPDYEAPPPTPSGFSAEAVSASQIDLTWNTSPRTNWYWVGLPARGEWTIVVSPDTTASWPGLEAGTEYCFEVLAVNEGDPRDPADQVSAPASACATTWTAAGVNAASLPSTTARD